jgi:hypothetical protein
MQAATRLQTTAPGWQSLTKRGHARCGNGSPDEDALPLGYQEQVRSVLPNPLAAPQQREAGALHLKASWSKLFAAACFPALSSCTLALLTSRRAHAAPESTGP